MFWSWICYNTARLEKRKKSIPSIILSQPVREIFLAEYKGKSTEYEKNNGKFTHKSNRRLPLLNARHNIYSYPDLLLFPSYDRVSTVGDAAVLKGQAKN